MDCNFVLLVLVIGVFERYPVWGLQDDGLSLMSNAWKENVQKRNTWWSKKSVPLSDEEPSSSNFFTEDNTFGNSVINAVGCYIDTCVPNFLECSRLADSKPAFLRCRHGHRRCIGGCFKNAKNMMENDQ